MITRTFVEKTNTIANTSDENFGLNPICTISYGKGVSRVLLYFSEQKLKELVENKTYKDIDKLSHRLKMFNCGSADPKKFMERDEMREFLSSKHRASSFDIIAFKVPQEWDAGDGFDNSTDTWFLGYKSYSTDGSTWNKPMNGATWQCKKDKEGKIVNTPGIYTTDFLSSEYEKWGRGEKSVIIGRQHFDYGNENLDIDITDYVNEILSEKSKNYGICLAFSPALEEIDTVNVNYINFFGPKTNTFFAPYIESRYDCRINDQRYKFHVGSTNSLYFYFLNNGAFTDFDEMPTCEINGVNYEVLSETKGIYHVDVKLPKNVKENQILIDTWGNLIINGEHEEDVEMEFVTLPRSNSLNLGGEIEDTREFTPVISGINDDQKLYQGDIREITVLFKVPYQSSQYELIDCAYYRIYVKDGNREIDVIDWDPINTIGKRNSFMLKTDELLPQDYFVDIKANIGRQTIIYKNKLHFKVVDNVTEIKR